VQAECQSERWAVFTTIQPATDSVRRLDELSGWCIVVVGDRKSVPAEAFFPGARRLVYLDAERQRALGYRIVDVLPWDTYGRKAIGYLYAMHAGAELILDLDDDNLYTGGPAFFARLEQGAVPMVTARAGTCPSFNPYPAFGANAWPRGFPLDQIQASPTVQSSEAKLSAVAVIQILADENPDVDATFRLERSLPLRFEPDERMLALGKCVYAPFNAQATVWKKAAFPMLLLPTSVHGRVADIWRSYLAQTLLWRSDHLVAFTNPLVNAAARNDHNLLGDLDAEIPLYERAGEILTFLGKREYSPGVAGLFEAYKDFYEYGLIEEADMKLVTAWIQDLYDLELSDVEVTVEVGPGGVQRADRTGSEEWGKLEQAHHRHGSKGKYLLQSVDQSEQPSDAVLALALSSTLVCFLIGIWSGNYLTRVALGFMACSGTMLLCNKFAIFYLQLPLTVIFCQFVFSAAVTRIAYSLGAVQMEFLRWDNAAWLSLVPASVSFLVSIAAGSKILQFANVETMVAVRSSVVLVICLLESAILTKTLPSWTSFLCLLTVSAGGVGYTYFEAGTFTVFIFVSVLVWCVTFCFDQIFIKHTIMKLHLPTWSYVYYSNLIMALCIFPLALFEGRNTWCHRSYWHLSSGRSGVLLVTSCVAASAISFFSFAAREAFSATQVSLMGNACRVLTIIFNATVWKHHATTEGLLALLVILAGSWLYEDGVARNKDKKWKEISNNQG
jgi:hypothetical protein